MLDQRVAEQRSRPQSAVPSVSRLPLQSASRPRDAAHGAAREPREPDAYRQVEPDDGVGGVEHERADLALRSVPSITQPSLRTIGSTIARSSSSGVSVQSGPCTSASSSTKRTPSRAASARPRVVLPLPLAEAMMATRRIGPSVPGSQGIDTATDVQPRCGASRSSLGLDLALRQLLGERLDGDVEPLALLAAAPERDRLAVGEHDPHPAERRPDLLARRRIGEQRLAVAAEQDRVAGREQAHAVEPSCGAGASSTELPQLLARARGRGRPSRRSGRPRRCRRCAR